MGKDGRKVRDGFPFFVFEGLLSIHNILLITLNELIVRRRSLQCVVSLFV